MNEQDSASNDLTCSFRYCFYLHLGTAKSNGESWYDHEMKAHPVFSVNGKARWVLAVQREGSDSAQIFQLTSKSKTFGGYEKPNHLLLGRVIGNRDSTIPRMKSWVRCIPEIYPVKLIEEAEKHYRKEEQSIDPATANSYLKIIMDKSPFNWLGSQQRSKD